MKRELSEELCIDVDVCDIIEFDNNVLTTEKLILTIFIVKKWNYELKINPEINSEILEIDINQLENVKNLLETDMLLIPAVLKALK